MIGPRLPTWYAQTARISPRLQKSIFNLGKKKKKLDIYEFGLPPTIRPRVTTWWSGSISGRNEQTAAPLNKDVSLERHLLLNRIKGATNLGVVFCVGTFLVIWQYIYFFYFIKNHKFLYKKFNYFYFYTHPSIWIKFEIKFI